jgi:hypothetical protein
MIPESDVQVLITEASRALDNRQYAQAEELQRRAVKLLEERSDESVRVADELEKLAGIHLQQGKNALAAGEYERVLKSREALASANDSRVLRVLYLLGKAHFNDAKYDLAESAFRRGLAELQTRPDSTREVAQFLCELGFLLYFVGRYREAEPYLLQAVPLYDKLFGENHPTTVWVLERLALNYDHCPEIGKDPEPYYRKAAEALNPKEHKAEYVANLCRWAECLVERKCFEQADELYGRLLPLIDESPEWGSDWHWILSHCVNYFRSRGKGDLVAHLSSKAAGYDAFGYLTQQRLERAEQTLPDDDPELADALLDAGNNALFHHNYSEAETLLGRALDSNIKAHGEESEAVVENLNRLCVVSRELKKYDEAENII